MQYKIIVDKQPSSNPSSEKKEYVIDIEELRVKGDVYDSLVITKDEDYVMRRLSLSEYGVLSVLEQEVKVPLENVNIELFEGDNYIYLIDMQGNKFYAEYLIKNDFNDIYATKNEMNSAITQSAESIEFSVNQKLTSYATTDDLEGAVTELNSTISQKASEINAEVEKKVDEETITGAYLILKINVDTSEAKLNADKIELSANDILNLLAGNTINLTSKNIVIASDNFNVDKNGNVECQNINIKSGKVKLESGSASNPNFQIGGEDGVFITGNYFLMGENSLGSNFLEIGVSSYENPRIGLHSSSSHTEILASGITTPSLVCPDIDQSSLESMKKNISDFTKNATEIINNSDVYEYNLKTDNDTDRKTIGFIIGDKYKTPNEIVSKDEKAIRIYSAIGILWKAVQELSAKVEQLEKEVQHE